MATDDTKGNAGDGSKRAGGVLHQRRSLPFSPATMAIGGFVIVAAIGYFTLYSKSKPGTRLSDGAKSSSAIDDGARRSK